MEDKKYPGKKKESARIQKPKGNKNLTTPIEVENAIKLEELALAWSKLGLHLTTRRYRQIAKEGRVPEPVRGYVDALKCLIQISTYYQSMGEGRGDVTHEEEKKLKTHEERLMAEMERKKMEGSLIDRDTVADELVRRIYILKSDLLAIEKRLARWPDAKDLVAKQVRHLMRVYSRKTGVFSE